jgi:hypothetical protein
MWFVWDGRTRTGPLSEQELCRRVSAGQIALSVYVRPENLAVYRPLTWMLPLWTSARPQSELEQTFVRDSAPMNDATQVAMLDPRFNQSLSPVQPAPDVPRPANRPPSDEIDFFSPPPPAAPVIVPSPPPPSPPPPAAPQTRDDPAAQAVAAAILHGQLETQEFEERIRDDESADLAVEAPRISKVGDRKGGKGVQSPALASEGSVNLFSQNSATQIKFRRVNPTAPRRKPKNSALRFASSAFSRRRGQSNLIFMTGAFLLLAVIGLIVFYLYEKKQNQNLARINQRVSRKQLEIDSGENPVRTAQPRRTTKKKESGKSLASKPNPTPPPVQSQNTVKIYSTGSDLVQYLKNRGAGGAGGFIVVGPVTLRQRPKKRCEPCFASGKLPDGSTINLTSGIAEPWNAVRGSSVIYARGFLLGSANLTLTVNKLGTTPP